MSDRTCVSRRQILLSGGLAATVPLLASARPAATFVRRPDVAGAPPPEQVHVQFGADAATQIAVSWAARTAVFRPRLRVGLHGGASGREVPAQERVYTEALTGEIVYTYHAAVGSLPPDTAFGYEVVHEAAGPVAGTFRTGPRGRGKGFRFTSFGDQSIPARSAWGWVPARPTLATSSMPSTRSTHCST
jgi:phosphodiesterase/alkaline phosphatase D-like protein